MVWIPEIPSFDKPEVREIDCPECGGKMVLRETSKFKHKDGSNRKFYGCSNFPSCNATHGAHPNGDPLGVPGDKATKEARIAAHEVFDDLWRSGKMTRSGAYAWLARKMGRDEVHFAEMSIEECNEAIEIIEEKI